MVHTFLRGLLISASAHHAAALNTIQTRILVWKAIPSMLITTFSADLVKSYHAGLHHYPPFLPPRCAVSAAARQMAGAAYFGIVL